MMKRIVKPLFVFSLFFLLVFNVSADESMSVDGYYIKSYDVNVDVKRDNSLDVTETITAYFTEEKHGIFKINPYQNTIVRNDGSSYKKNIKISNVSVNDDYITYNQDGKHFIKIGSENKTVIGEKTYVIKYNYEFGSDRSKSFDELYYAIIGLDWGTYINNVTFKINMPKSFDTNKIGFSVGKYGAIGYENVDFSVDGNTIIGSYNKPLLPYQGVIVRIELEEGYFDEVTSPINALTYILYSLPVVSLFVSLFMWNKYGRDDEVIETVEFYPPEGMNSLDVAFAYNGSASSKDVTSLLIYLANKGYLKIEETEKKDIFKKNSFTIYKLKEYDGDNDQERKFMDGLFKSASIVPDENSTDEYMGVTKEDLYDSFYTTMNSILNKTNSGANKNKIFEKNGGRTFLTVALAIISLVIIIYLPFKELADAGELFFMFFIPIMVSGVMMFALLYSILKNGGKGKIFRVVFASVWLFPVLPFVFITGSYDTFKDYFMFYPIYFLGLIVGLVSIIGMIIFAVIMRKRTKYGTEVLGKLRGFKNFLETAEKDKLEALVEENPTYFYDILPYTYVLGVSNKWIKKFEDINLKEPDWYVGTTAFDLGGFDSFMDSTMNSAVTAMSSSPSRDSFGDGSFGGGGGFSGGGFSGGGFGSGAGGGSW